MTATGAVIVAMLIFGTCYGSILSEVRHSDLVYIQRAAEQRAERRYQILDRCRRGR